MAQSTSSRPTSSQYTTNQEAMQHAAAAVDDAADQIQGHLTGLRGEVETMLGGWRGEAAGAFSQVHAAFEGQATRINGALRQMHEALLATQRTYGLQESSQTRTLTGLAGQING